VSSPLPTTGPGWRVINTPAGGESLKVQWIEIDAPEGYKLNAAVFLPSGEGPFPVVIVLHGSAGFVMRTVVLGEVFAKAGFLTIAGAWFAGSGEKSPTSPTPIASPYGPPFSGANLDSIKYVKALVNAAKTLPRADSHNVGLFGISRGAIAALLVASTDGVQAVVADSGSGTVAAINIDTSPMDVVETLAAPVLLLHSTVDQIVPVESIQMYESVLKQWRKTHEVYYYEGGGHAVTQQQETRADARKRAVDFFTKYLALASPSQ
jgi:dienelactone hydrolase